MFVKRKSRLITFVLQYMHNVLCPLDFLFFYMCPAAHFSEGVRSGILQKCLLEGLHLQWLWHGLLLLLLVLHGGMFHFVFEDVSVFFSRTNFVNCSKKCQRVPMLSFITFDHKLTFLHVLRQFWHPTSPLIN